MSPTTELEAVNAMLAMIDEAPVTSLDDESMADIPLALNELRRTSRQVQAEGWRFNTDFSYPLAPVTAPGEIIVPTNVISLDSSDQNVYPAIREGKLWDRQNRTFTWPEGIACDIVWLFDFETIPETAREYITASACRKFVQQRFDENSRRASDARADEARARLQLERAESLEPKASMANSPAVARVLHPNRLAISNGIGRPRRF